MVMGVVVVAVLLLWASPAAYAVDPGMQCEICDSSSYCFNEVRGICPANSQALQGSSRVDDCVCNGGYYNQSNTPGYGHQCVLCEPGYVCVRGQPRALCPTNMHSDAFTDNSDACYCMAGYGFVDQSTCLACIPGTHKPLPSDGVCDACLQGSYQGAEAATDCLPCPAYMSSATQSVTAAACQSIPGFYTLDGNVLPCARGSYQPDSGQVVCLVCGYGDTATSYYSSVEASADSNDCIQCPPNSHIPSGLSGSQETDCVCRPGHSLSSCEPCPVGSFKLISGPSECQVCPVNYYSSGPGTIACSDCHTNSVSIVNSTSIEACICIAGFGAALVNDLPECTQCVGGQFKNLSGSCETCGVGTFAVDGLGAGCEDCTAGKYTNAPGSASCLSCRDNSNSLVGSSSINACLCVVGYEFATSCTACKYGYYKNSEANTMCLACPPGATTSDTASSALTYCKLCSASKYATEDSLGVTCIDCTPNSQSVQGSTMSVNCSCNAGFTPSSNTCSSCTSGKYKTIPGSALCMSCASGKIGFNPAIHSSEAIILALKNINIRDSESFFCINCPVNTYRSSLTVCTNCTVNSQSVVRTNTITNCLCNSGFGFVSTPKTCIACQAGTYKLLKGNSVCAACELGSFATGTSSLQCQSCPANSQQLFTDPTRTSADNCICIAGYSISAGACTLCPEGSFNPDQGQPCVLCSSGHYYAVSSAPFTTDLCAVCMQNSNSVEGSYSINSCVCVLGFMRYINTCIECTVGYYCENEHSYTICPIFSESAAGSSQVSDCKCIAGYFLNTTSSMCQICHVNSYCTGDQLMTGCKSNSSTLGLPGSQLEAECVCVNGYYDSAGDCELCPEDTYCWLEEIHECPHNSSSTPGQYLVASCICDAMYRSVSEDTCERCADNEVCRGGNSEIETCVEGAHNFNQNCVCRDGLYCDGLPTDETSCVDPFTCMVCPVDSYCSHNALASCQLNMEAPTNSSAPSSCVCRRGYYRTGSSCAECPVGSYCLAEIQHKCSDYDNKTHTRGAMKFNEIDCVCVDGFFRLFYGDMCRACPFNFFCPPSALDLDVRGCHEHAYTIAEGSSQLSECQCGVGFTLSEDGSSSKCFECDPNTRCSLGEAPENCQGDEIPNHDHSRCVCALGSGISGVNCLPCVAGSYRNSTLIDHCVLCEAGKSSFNTTLCEDCIAFSDPSEDHSSCICHTPRVMQGDKCVLCDHGTFYDESTSYCEWCPQYSQIPYAVKATDTKYDVSLCECLQGFVSGDVDHCEPCASNTYEVDGVCMPCGQSAASEMGSSTQSQCVCDNALCLVKVWGAECSGSCENPPDPCHACLAGHFKPEVSVQGNAEPSCIMCGAAKFQDQTHASVCLDCHDTRTHITQGSTDILSCECKAGYQAATGLECTQCSIGFAKSNVGNQVCTACLQGEFANSIGSMYCKSCRTESPVTGATATPGTGSSSVAACTCEMGFSLDTATNTCVSCQSGSFKDMVGGHACTLCGSNTDTLINKYGDGLVAATSITHCVSCPSNSGQDTDTISSSSRMASVYDCVCMGGFHQFSTTLGCTACPQYQQKTGFSATECRLCGEGDFFTESYQTCARCQLISSGSSLETDLHSGLVINSVNVDFLWGVSSEDCACSLGWYKVNGECQRCEPGYFRNNRTIGTCSLCTRGSYQISSGAILCQTCPANSHTYSDVSTAITACKCHAGYEWSPGTQTCVGCTPGKFNTNIDSTCKTCSDGFFSNSTAQIACFACEQNEYSALPRNKVSLCRCNPGFGGNPNVCTLCTYGKYSVGGISGFRRQACQTCPVNKNTTLTTRTVVADCKCVSGHGDANNNADETSACVICTTGKYAPGSINAPCKSCGYGAITDPAEGASSFTMCMCNAATGLYAFSGFVIPLPIQYMSA